MIKKVLVTAGIVAASVGMAVPAFADPASFGDISCACQPPVPQFFIPSPEDQVDQGIQQGLLDTTPGPIQH